MPWTSVPKAKDIIQDSYEENPMTCSKGIVTRDRFDCTRADAVLFNMLGAKTVSIGTCIEFGWADAARNPVVLVMEDASNLHDHPMVREIAGFRVNDLDAGIRLLERILLPEGSGTHRDLDTFLGRPSRVEEGF